MTAIFEKEIQVFSSYEKDKEGNILEKSKNK
jgi:hypothetical protein